MHGEHCQSNEDDTKTIMSRAARIIWSFKLATQMQRLGFWHA